MLREMDDFTPGMEHFTPENGACYTGKWSILHRKNEHFTPENGAFYTEEMEPFPPEP